MCVLTDRGTEYCGSREHHEYQLYLVIEDIDHTKIKAKSPQTNGICERFNRTVKNEFYDIAFRKKIYSSMEQLQEDLDQWRLDYNTNRTHTGKFCFGRTPMKTFIESIHITKEHYLENRTESNTPDQANTSNNVGARRDYLKTQVESLPVKAQSDNFYNPL